MVSIYFRRCDCFGCWGALNLSSLCDPNEKDGVNERGMAFTPPPPQLLAPSSLLSDSFISSTARTHQPCHGISCMRKRMFKQNVDAW